jgi:multisubunit Na+/H+ antiporter MnhE subunit
MRRLLATLALAATYLAALGQAAPADLALGLLIGAVLGSWLPAGRGPAPAALVRGIAGLPRFLLAAAGSILSGSGTMLLVVLGLRSTARMGLVEVPLDGRTDLGITVTGLVTILSPGSILVDVDRRRGVLLFHVLDASDPDHVRARLERFYRDHQRPVFR